VSIDRADLLGAALGVACALVPALLLWGFTVDDALIIARYSTNLAHGAGYRFNVDGPITDGVTPLGFALLLAPFAREGPLTALAAAKGLGLAAWLVGSALLGVSVRRLASTRALTALLLVVASAPLAAWSVAGLETGLVTGLAAAGVSLVYIGWPVLAAALLGVAAGLRPELVVFAALVAIAPTASTGAWWPRLTRLAIAIAPFAVAAFARLQLFGQPAPLSALAKPADLSLGVKYALACALLTGPLVLVAPRAWARFKARSNVVLGAVGAHFVVVALAGGDWMPLSRLVVPVLPAVVLLAAELATLTTLRSSVARGTLALVAQLFVFVKVGPSAASVGDDRRRLIEELRPVLSSSERVASIDIGWLGAATRASILDLAGVTDPSIARLAGGHTTKRISADLLDGRGIDTLVLLLAYGEALRMPWEASVFSRGAEARIAAIAGVGEAFTPIAVSSRSTLHYVVLKRVRPRILAPSTGPVLPFEPE
jgi:hypothetical protein